MIRGKACGKGFMMRHGMTVTQATHSRNDNGGELSRELHVFDVNRENSPS
jgi:hypothetical protein